MQNVEQSDNNIYVKTNKTKKKKNPKYQVGLFWVYFLLCDYYETCTDNVKHKNEESFFLEMFQFNCLFLHNIKKGFTERICNTVLDLFAIIFIY